MTTERCSGRLPDLGQHADEVSAEHALDLGVAVLAADQTLRQIEHPLRVAEPLDVDLVPESVTALVARAQPLVELGRHVVVALERDVASDTEVLVANELPYMVVV